MSSPQKSVPAAHARGLIAVLKKAGLTSAEIATGTNLSPNLIGRISVTGKCSYDRVSKGTYDRLVSFFNQLNKDPDFHQKILQMSQEATENTMTEVEETVSGIDTQPHAEDHKEAAEIQGKEAAGSEVHDHDADDDKPLEFCSNQFEILVVKTVFKNWSDSIVRKLENLAQELK